MDGMVKRYHCKKCIFLDTSKPLKAKQNLKAKHYEYKLFYTTTTVSHQVHETSVRGKIKF